MFSVATVEIQVPQAADLDRAIEVAARVAREMREDPAWKDRFLEDAQTDIWVIGIGIDGASLRIQQRVPTGTHGPVASELRRRLAAALVFGFDRHGAMGHAPADIDRTHSLVTGSVGLAWLR